MYIYLSFASPLSQTLGIFIGTLTQDKSFLPYLRVGEQEDFLWGFLSFGG